MGWLFGQVWVLCAVSFLAGSAITWLLVRHAPAAADRQVVEPAQASAPPPSRPEPAPEAEPQAPDRPPVDSALGALDTGSFRVQSIGTAATGALDSLGVAKRDGPEIPAQAPPPSRER